MNGTNDLENLVRLTPEEHYLAHQLLVKMHPIHDGLIFAAMKMTVHQTNRRSSNKLYGWIKRKHQLILKQRIGKKNGSFGKFWYHHPETLECMKCAPEEKPFLFVSGRVPKKQESLCIVCKIKTGNYRRKYCKNHRSGNNYLSTEKRKQYVDVLKKTKSIHQSLNILGYKGGANYLMMKKIILEENLKEKFDAPNINWNIL